METTPIIKEKASLILDEIKKATSVLLHCHPSPDPDSVGSALAMKFALEQLGKKVTVIKGDSDIPESFMHFPGARDIVAQNFLETDLSAFDLFIAQDSGSIEMVSRRGQVVFPPSLKVVVIDHHRTNTGYGQINLIESSYPATAQVLFDLFKEWGVKLTPEIASNLFIGTYTDTGGFKYEGTTSKTFDSAAEMVSLIPNFHRLISDMENSSSPELLKYKGYALGSIETFLNDRVALSLVPYEFLVENKIPAEDSGAGLISMMMRSVGQWNIVGALVQIEPKKVKASFRTRDANLFDVSKLTVALGGGGHKAAAGAVIEGSLEEAKALVVAKIKELYNL
jgi:bifunctional oligoribonuclease and PAP phosphatase NrnA